MAQDDWATILQNIKTYMQVPTDGKGLYDAIKTNKSAGVIALRCASCAISFTKAFHLLQEEHLKAHSGPNFSCTSCGHVASDHEYLHVR